MKLPKKLREAREKRRKKIRDRIHAESKAYWAEWIKRNPEGPQ